MKTVLVVLLLSWLVGCTTYSHRETGNACANQNPRPITSFSFEFKSAYKNVDGGGEAFRAMTRTLLPDAAEVDAPPKESLPASHLDIQIAQNKAHYGGWDLFTGLSLGLIPSWATHTDLYVFEFKEVRGSQILATSQYAIDRHEYSHLVLLPVGIVQAIAVDWSPVEDGYRQALSKAIHPESCLN